MAADGRFLLPLLRQPVRRRQWAGNAAAQELGAGLRRGGRPRRLHPDQQPRGRQGRPHPGEVHRRSHRIRRQGGRRGCRHRPGRDPRGRQEGTRRRQDRQFRRRAGGRLGARHRLAVRLPGDRDRRHHQRQGTRSGSQHAVPALPADRRGHQSGQQRRPAAQHPRRSDRHQHRDRFALGRLPGHRASRCRSTPRRRSTTRSSRTAR